MKKFLLPVLFGALSVAARAAIVVPAADGSDGVLNLTVNTEIDLSQAPTGTWDQNNAANAGKGVYDPAKWAVVFKYSSVTVAPNVTVTFKNHASRAPVVWLVNGNVNIMGKVSLDGAISAVSPMLAEGGPGGSRGGSGYFSFGVGGAAGLGVGASLSLVAAGSYGAQGPSSSGQVYGNPSLIPLIGGSGGGGDDNQNPSGGGGGGAILIASTGAVDCSGIVTARGGEVVNGSPGYAPNAGAGSGGGIRVVCESLVGNGKFLTQGGLGDSLGGLGRIRIERAVNDNSLQIIPDPSVVPLTVGTTALLWPPAGAPEVKIVSVGSVNAPADPRATFGSAGADIALPQTPSTQVMIETTNVEQAAVVKARVTPRSNAGATVVTATLHTVVSTDPLVIRWVATLPVNTGYSAVQVHVVRP